MFLLYTNIRTKNNRLIKIVSVDNINIIPKRIWPTFPKEEICHRPAYKFSPTKRWPFYIRTKFSFFVELKFTNIVIATSPA